MHPSLHTPPPLPEPERITANPECFTFFPPELNPIKITKLLPSIQKHGVLNAPRGWRVGPEEVCLYSGRHRGRVCQLLGIQQITVMVYPTKPGELTIHKQAFADNADCTNLTLSERFAELRVIKELGGYDQQQLSLEMNVSPGEISRLFRTFDLAPPEVISLVDQRLFSAAAAYNGTPLEPEKQLSLARLAVEKRMTVAQHLTLVKHAMKGIRPGRKPSKLPLSLDFTNVAVLVESALAIAKKGKALVGTPAEGLTGQDLRKLFLEGGEK